MARKFKLTKQKRTPLRKIETFWKPVKHILKDKPKRDLTYKQAKKLFPKLNPYADADKDGIKNKFDCHPFDKWRDRYTKGPGGNYRWSATAKEMKSQYKKLREADIPASVAKRIRSWRPARVKQVIEGKREVPEIKYAREAKAKGLPLTSQQDRNYVEEWNKKNPGYHKKYYIEKQQNYIEKKISKRNRLGDCYNAACKTIVRLPEITNPKYVYGKVKPKQGPQAGKRFGHAWVEMGDVVMDTSNKKTKVIRKEHYYKAGDIDEQKLVKFSRDEVARLMVKTGRTGPYTPKQIKDTLDREATLQEIEAAQDTEDELKKYQSFEKDTDGDGVVDAVDCEPTNPNKQGKFHQNIPFKDAKFITVYHGTKKQSKSKILKEGLKHNIEKNYEMSQPRVYMTPSKASAARWSRAMDIGFIPPTVLKVKLTKEEYEKGWEQAKKDRPSFAGLNDEIAFRGDVPKERIKVLKKPRVYEEIEEIKSYRYLKQPEYYNWKKEDEDKKISQALQSLEIPKDSDGDLVVDAADCEPHNPNKQGRSHMLMKEIRKNIFPYSIYAPSIDANGDTRILKSAPHYHKDIDYKKEARKKYEKYIIDERRKEDLSYIPHIPPQMTKEGYKFSTPTTIVSILAKDPSLYARAKRLREKGVPIKMMHIEDELVGMTRVGYQGGRYNIKLKEIHVAPIHHKQYSIKKMLKHEMKHAEDVSGVPLEKIRERMMAEDEIKISRIFGSSKEKTYREKLEESANRSAGAPTAYEKARREAEKGPKPEVLKYQSLEKDTDKDGVVDGVDCEPTNPNKQGFFHRVEPSSKKSMKKFERYKPQVQKIVDVMSVKFTKEKGEIEREINKWRNRPDLYKKKVRPLIKERQKEDVGFFDYASIPGIRHGTEEQIKWEAGGKEPLHLIVEKGVVKGELLTKRRSPEAVEIKNLYINPEYRGEGLGTKAVRAVFKNPHTKRIVGIAIPGSREYWEKIGGKTTSSPEETEALEDFRARSFETSTPELKELGLKYKDLPPILKKELIKVTDEYGSPFEISREDFEKIAPEFKRVPEDEYVDTLERRRYERDKAASEQESQDAQELNDEYGATER